MASRRRFLAAVTSGAVAATSGCLGFLLGEEAQTFEASPATVEEGVAQESGYESLGTTEQTVSKTFEVSGEQRTVDVVNKFTEYHRTVSAGGLENAEASVFATFASPEVEILGETFNPVANLDAARILQQAQGQYENFQVGEQVAATTLDVLGAPRELRQFDGRATFSAGGVDVSIHLSNFTHGGDVVLPLGLYPKLLQTETERVFRMAEGLVH